MVGSSSSSSSGSCASARATKARCCWPPESAAICRRRKSPSRSAASACVDRCLIGSAEATQRPQAREAPHRYDVLNAGRETPIDRLDLRDVGDGPGGQGSRRLTKDVDRPSVGQDEAGDGFEQGRFAGPVRAYDSERFTLLEQEIDAFERNDSIVADPKVCDSDGY